MIHWSAVSLVIFFAAAAACGISLGCFKADFTQGKAETQRPVVGAIRWDGWSEGNEWERNLSPKQWHYRLPFYSRFVSEEKVEVRGDTQEVMDREIAYASRAGLDYWAFCYSYPGASRTDKHLYGLTLYLSSRRRSEINFCLILMGAGYSGPREEWPSAVEAFIRLFKEPTYQKVLGGRPLLYIYYVEQLPRYFGSKKAVRNAVDYLRQESVKAGLKPPYLVAQVWSAQSGAKCVDKYGFDAVSAYAMIHPGGGNQEYPYSVLTSAAEAYWNACKATGKQVIPIVMTGWDNRPRRANEKRFVELYQQPPQGPVYAAPTPTELANHLRAALQWNRENPKSAEANAVIIYAWNESDEGGWLMPTLGEGTARLHAIKKVLEADDWQRWPADQEKSGKEAGE